jgi:hypothetical protein
MEEKFEKNAEQAAAFQKMWLESMSKMMQAAFTFSPNSPPPEVMRQIRSGIFSALADSWDKFMRSPEFLEGMRQWMEQAIAFRKTTSDFMARVRNELQSPSRDDIDSVMLTVRHMEKRLLDRMESLAAQIDELKERPEGTKRAAARGASRSRRANKEPGARSPSNGQAQKP